MMTAAAAAAKTTIIKLLCEHKLAMDSVIQEIREAIQMV
jgi:hypothetical protein